MRRWTLVAIIALFVGLIVAAVLQLTVGRKHLQCPGPHAHLGGRNAIVHCLTPTPTPS